MRPLNRWWLSALLILGACAKSPEATRPEIDQPLPSEEAAAEPASASDEAPKTGQTDDALDLTPETKEAQAAREAAEEEARKKAELEAQQALEQAEQAKLADAFSRVQRAMSLGRNGEAVVELKKAIEAQPQAHAAHYNLGLLLERQGNLNGAADAYRQALEIKPDYELASANLTRLYVRTRQFARAEQELKKRIVAFPRNTAFRNQLVRVLMEQGPERVRHAEAESKRVLKFDERNVEAMLNLGILWFREGKYELSKQVLDNAREIDPTNAAVWNLIAFTQMQLDMKPLALDSFRKAAELREDFPEAHNNLGAMLNEVNDCDGAIRELELAVRYAPDWAEARQNLGNAYRCARQYEKAQAEYEKALELDAKSGDKIRMSDPYFNLAILYLDGDLPGIEKLARLQKSVAYFDEYRSAGGNDPRTERYLDEAHKNIEKETKRLERVAEQERRAAERKRQEEERLRAEEEKRKAEEERRLAAERERLAEIERLKVGGKADIEWTPPQPKVIEAPPAETTVEEKVEEPLPKMQKVPKEDFL